MLHRRQFLSSLATPLLAQRRPLNVVVLFTDDQRFDTVRALGNSEISTPNMDRLVRSGTAFTHAHIMGGTTGAVCVPSRAMLMTGQSLFHVHRSIVEPKQFPDSAKKPFHLFPEVFRQAGYDTFGCGKWHNQPELYARCFSAGGPIFFGGMSDQNHVSVADFDPSGQYPASKRQTADRYSSEMFATAAVDFLRQRKPAGNPFLAYVAFTSPHDPRTAPAKFAAMYSPDKVSLPKNFRPEHGFDNGELTVRDELLARFPRTEAEVRRHLADYYAMVSEVDSQIGRVLDTLDSTGLAENTLVVFAGDNGLAVGQHGLMGKQNVYDHSVRVPLVLRGPGIAPGRQDPSLVYTFDLFPTLCRQAGLPVPATVEGRDLLSGPRRDSIFCGYRTFMRSVRTKDDWKLIRYTVNGTERVQLFKLRADPHEMDDLSATEPGRVAQLRARLAQWQREQNDILTT
ncbi:MAG: sulfatase-like hydrolase/transferase [Acidobacteria bacterium]|nr:sulfatase-like hydrolase/transferase [Acidobacteriota bacterium]